MNNFLYVLSQWTRTFPYDFRNSEMISQLEDLFKKITSFEPTLQSDVQHIYKKLRSKVTFPCRKHPHSMSLFISVESLRLLRRIRSTIEQKSYVQPNATSPRCKSHFYPTKNVPNFVFLDGYHEWMSNRNPIRSTTNSHWTGSILNLLPNNICSLIRFFS